MFPVYSKTVDMFLTTLFAYRHGDYDYQFHFLKPRRDGDITVKGKTERLKSP
jgi:hypothetical protein